MTSDSDLSHAALLDRADRAIANALAIRAEVRASLEMAGRRSAIRPWICDPPASEVVWPEPLPSLGFLDLWRAVARAFSGIGEITPEADMELDRAWQRILPTIETPLTLFQG